MWHAQKHFFKHENEYSHVNIHDWPWKRRIRLTPKMQQYQDKLKEKREKTNERLEKALTN